MRSTVIKNHTVRYAPGLEPLDAPQRKGEPALARDAEPCAKLARLVQTDGRVDAIELVCSCGEVTVVELEYTPTNENPAAGTSPPPEQA